MYKIIGQNIHGSGTAGYSALIEFFSAGGGPLGGNASSALEQLSVNHMKYFIYGTTIQHGILLVLPLVGL